MLIQVGTSIEVMLGQARPYGATVKTNRSIGGCQTEPYQIICQEVEYNLRTTRLSIRWRVLGYEKWNTVVKTLM